MKPLDLKEFEWKTVVRPLELDDFDALVEMAKRCFPGMLPWERDQIESQLSIFPEGQICVEIDRSFTGGRYVIPAQAGMTRNTAPVLKPVTGYDLAHSARQPARNTTGP